MKSSYLILFLLFVLSACKTESHTKNVNNTSSEIISINSFDQANSINKDSIVNIDSSDQVKKIDTAIKHDSDIQFQSLDKILISAKLYEIDNTSPVIVLCHQAGYNKYEYSSIALALNKMGFNCIAIDQRSGGEMKNAKGEVLVNETSIRAKKEGKPTKYKDYE